VLVRKKIKVLIVEDSLLFRETLTISLSMDPLIEIVGTAENAIIAKEKIHELKPDVITLDVQLPKMNGLDFLKNVMPQYKIPVIVVSSISDSVFDALKFGAVDFVTKPDSQYSITYKSFINELLVKIKIASTATIKSNITELATNNLKKIINNPQNLIIAIGASTGGTEALERVLSELPGNMPGIVIVQHMPPIFTDMFAKRLNNNCALNVKEAQTGDTIKQGLVLIAPGDHHMIIKKAGNDFFVECSKGDKVNGHCPSVDVLFNSVATHAKRRAIGVILTGMGSDGSKGLLTMRANGAHTIGQNEQSSVVYGMPKVAHDIGAVQKQIHLNLIAKELYNLVNI
jgi:two-component system chemotaxis response regulator CheB